MNSRWEHSLHASPIANGLITLTLALSLAGIPLGIVGLYSRQMGDPWISRWLAPAYGHLVALVWILAALGWARGQARRMAEIPERSVERVERQAELDEAARGISMVLGGTLIGSWLAMGSCRDSWDDPGPLTFLSFRLGKITRVGTGQGGPAKRIET